MKLFDCQAMPDEIKELFFDSYRLPNNSVATIYVGEQRKPLKQWLVQNGCELEEDVQVKCWWEYRKIDKKVDKLFSYKDYRSDDEDSDEGFFDDEPVIDLD